MCEHGFDEHALRLAWLAGSQTKDSSEHPEQQAGRELTHDAGVYTPANSGPALSGSPSRVNFTEPSEQWRANSAQRIDWPSPAQRNPPTYSAALYRSPYPEPSEQRDFKGHSFMTAHERSAKRTGKRTLEIHNAFKQLGRFHAQAYQSPPPSCTTEISRCSRDQSIDVIIEEPPAPH